MTAPDLTYEDDPATRGLRMEGRDSLYLPVEIRVAGGVSTQSIRVRNLSPSGLMAEAAVTYAIGTSVSIEWTTHQPVRGRVVWALDGRMGIALDAPVDPMSVRQATIKAPVLAACDAKVMASRRLRLRQR